MEPVICPRCKREARGWPLWRGDRCSPKDWGTCLREPLTILALKAARTED